MKIAVLIARILLGLLFAVFGLNGFLHFIPMKPPTGLAGQYMGALFVSHYLVVVFLLQLIGGVLLLLNRFVPLALLLLSLQVLLLLLQVFLQLLRVFSQQVSLQLVLPLVFWLLPSSSLLHKCVGKSRHSRTANSGVVSLGMQVFFA